MCAISGTFGFNLAHPVKGKGGKNELRNRENKEGKELVKISVVCEFMYLRSCWSDLSDITFLLSDLNLNLHPSSLSDDFWTDLKPWADISLVRAPNRAAIYWQAEIESRCRKAPFQGLRHDHTGSAELECVAAMTSFQSNEPQNVMGLKLVR